VSEREALARFDALLDLDSAERERALAKLAVDEPEVGALVAQWFQSEPMPEPRLDPEHYTPLLPVLPDESEPTPNAGDRIGPYRLVHEIGRGGMGSVWLAERAEGDFKQQVALKLIRPDLGSPEAEPRFRRERQILAGLKHPNIAQLLDGGVTADGRCGSRWNTSAAIRCASS
jgi:serine/threonine-protein kinase